MRRLGDHIGIALILSMVMLFAACATTPAALSDSKKALKAADSAWKVAQHSFASAYVEGKLTEEQNDRFRAVDKKFLASARLATNAVKAWDKGTTPDGTNLALLMTNMLSVMVEGAKLAAEFGLDIKDLVKMAEEAKKAGVQ